MATGIQIDENGISVSSYRELRASLVQKMKGIFGESLDLSPSSPDGQLIDLFGFVYDEAKLAIQGAFASLDVDTAEGTFLDNVAAIMGLSRMEGEDDASLRARLVVADTSGRATFDGMLTYLRDTLGPLVSLEENCEPDTDSAGLPGHSIAVYIPESYSEIEDDSIAQAIWNCKPAGIKSYGTSTGVAVDVAGMQHDVSFFRVDIVTTFYMKVTITEYTEEKLPDDYSDQLVAQIANWAVTEYTRGKDIIPQRAIQAIYKVPGIDTVQVQVSLDGSEWTTSRISVSQAAYASLPAENLTIVGP